MKWYRSDSKGLNIAAQDALSITMADKEKSGFQSSAGLIRYFDTEDEKSIKLNPYIIIGLAVVTIIVVTAAGYLWPV